MLLVDERTLAAALLAGFYLLIGADAQTSAPSAVCHTSPTRPIIRRSTEPPTMSPVVGIVVGEEDSNVEVGSNVSTTCECVLKENLMEGDGKVTGGGWIYLTEASYFDCGLLGGSGTLSCENLMNIDGSGGRGGIVQQKANYGFVAMFRNGAPRGSTNFDLDGASFHFHSDVANTPYKLLRVPTMNHSCWMGTGIVSSKSKPKKKDWDKGFCFMVAAQDNGEPGLNDEFRLRVWMCGYQKCGNKACSPTCCPDGTCTKSIYFGDPKDWSTDDFLKVAAREDCLVFDTNYLPDAVSDFPVLGYVNLGSYRSDYPIPASSSFLDVPENFAGINVGSTTAGAHGGGNIQIHKKNKVNIRVKSWEESGYNCTAPGNICNPTEMQDADRGFVTGGGWISLDEQSFLRPYVASEPRKYCAVITTTGKSKCLNSTACTYNYPLDWVESVNVTGLRANYGFNAKHINGVPQGSFNFNILGNGFHFRTDEMSYLPNNAEYDCLQIVCDLNSADLGPSGFAQVARWTGVGKVARTISNTPSMNVNPNDWIGGYRFWLEVIDFGEPGYYDTIRLRIEDSGSVGCNDGSLLFDTDVMAGPVFIPDDVGVGSGHVCGGYTWSSSLYANRNLVKSIVDPVCRFDPTGDFCKNVDWDGGTSLADRAMGEEVLAWYSGTQVGEVSALDDFVGGGGNIQVHCKGGPAR